ncbi:MAG: TRAP transporter substrate-binding protein DctP [Pseudomonadota bacterium]
MRLVQSTALVAVLGASLSAAPALAETTLRAGVFLPPQAVFSMPFVRFADRVNAECSGLVNIEVTGPEAFNAFEQPNALKTGILDMLATPGTYYKGDMIEIDTLILGNVPMTEQRENGAWEYMNRLHNERMNAHYLTSYGDGIGFFIWTKEKSADGRFDDVRLRSSPIYETFFQSLGATTAQLPPSQIYTALERGTVDGFGWPSWGVADFGWQEQTNYQHGPAFFNVMVGIIVNNDVWGGLSDDARACLTEQAIWMEGQWATWLAEQNALEEDKVKAADIEYVDLGEGFTQQAYDTYWTFLEEQSPEHVPALRALVTKE